MNKSRRQFLKSTAFVAGASLLAGGSPLYAASASNNDELNISIFSKHLQFLSYEDMASVVKQMGFNGVDLTVRKGGHVEPAKVESDLPKVVSMLKKYGIQPNMITTEVSNAAIQEHVNVLKTASELGFKNYRTNWLNYNEQLGIEKSLEKYNAQFKALATINKRLGITGGYQNHAGAKIGSSVWDLPMLLNGIDSDCMGVHYDIRHATVEGTHAWKLGFERIKHHINAIVLKDFKWDSVKGKSQIVNTPIGEGMVDFDHFFKLLKKNKINVPISIHLEYNIGGAQFGKRKLTMPQEKIFLAMEKDLNVVRRMWKIA